jgi:methylated-DNA-[protein]-cysteine S-methyltransferase
MKINRNISKNSLILCKLTKIWVMSYPYRKYYKSPLGWLELVSNDRALLSLHFVEIRQFGNRTNPILDFTVFQLKEYFAGKRKQFDIPLEPLGTPFQQAVWKTVSEIPFGQVITYHQIAEKTGISHSDRASGAAVARNPVAIIIPCHRVIGSDDSLTGYAGGIWRKEWLLKHEGFLLF